MDLGSLYPRPAWRALMASAVNVPGHLFHRLESRSVDLSRRFGGSHSSFTSSRVFSHASQDHGKYHVNSHSCARALCHIRLTSLTTHVIAKITLTKTISRGCRCGVSKLTYRECHEYCIRVEIESSDRNNAIQITELWISDRSCDVFFFHIFNEMRFIRIL